MTTPHSQDMRGLRFRSTFSGAPLLISFRQHHPCGAGPHRQQELGIWGERRRGRADTLDQVSETRLLQGTVGQDAFFFIHQGHLPSLFPTLKSLSTALTIPKTILM